MNIDVKPTNQNYPAYFFDDLRKSKINLVVGGTEYKRELKKKVVLAEIISQLISANRVRRIPDEPVDQHEQALKNRIVAVIGSCPKECDDHHIMALSFVSGCNNILTQDRRMNICRNAIRNRVGHDYCPDIRTVMTEAAYNDT